jgi:hypothetical protein
MPIRDHNGQAGKRPAGRMENRGSRMTAQELRERIRCGTYQVDAGRVADAMLRRRGVRRLLLGGRSSDDVLEPGD